jgi:hypothetical protein
LEEADPLVQKGIVGALVDFLYQEGRLHESAYQERQTRSAMPLAIWKRYPPGAGASAK